MIVAGPQFETICFFLRIWALQEFATLVARYRREHQETSSTMGKIVKKSNWSSQWIFNSTGPPDEVSSGELLVKKSNKKLTNNHHFTHK